MIVNTELSECDANAALYNILSLAFSYPGPELLAALVQGEFADSVRQCIEALPQQDSTAAALQAFENDFGPFPATYTLEQLGSEYIGLFELNRQHPPLHLNAHLYLAGEPNPVPVYQQLNETYRAFGLEIGSGEGVEGPDHLTAQLEFLGYLYRLLGQSLRGQSDEPAQPVQAAIAAFYRQLDWVEKWLAALEQREPHPLYTPLGRLLWALLSAGIATAR